MGSIQSDKSQSDFQFSPLLRDRFQIGKSWQKQLIDYASKSPLAELEESGAALNRRTEISDEAIAKFVAVVRRSAPWFDKLQTAKDGDSATKNSRAAISDRGPELLIKFIALPIADYQVKHLDPSLQLAWKYKAHLGGTLAQELVLVREVGELVAKSFSSDPRVARNFLTDIRDEFRQISLFGEGGAPTSSATSPTVALERVNRMAAPYLRIIDTWGLGEVYARVIESPEYLEEQSGARASGFVKWIRSLSIAPAPLGPRESQLRNDLVDSAPTGSRIATIKLTLTEPRVIAVYDQLKDRLSPREVVSFFLERGSAPVGKDTLGELVFTALGSKNGAEIALFLIGTNGEEWAGAAGGARALIAHASKSELGARLLQDFTNWLTKGEPLKAQVIAWAVARELEDPQLVILLRKKLGNSRLDEKSAREFLAWMRKTKLLGPDEVVPGLGR